MKRGWKTRGRVKSLWESDAAKQVAKGRKVGKRFKSRIGFQENEERVALFVCLFEPPQRLLALCKANGRNGQK